MKRLPILFLCLLLILCACGKEGHTQIDFSPAGNGRTFYYIGKEDGAIYYYNGATSKQFATDQAASAMTVRGDYLLTFYTDSAGATTTNVYKKNGELVNTMNLPAASHSQYSPFTLSGEYMYTLENYKLVRQPYAEQVKSEEIDDAALYSVVDNGHGVVYYCALRDGVRLCAYDTLTGKKSTVEAPELAESVQAGVLNATDKYIAVAAQYDTDANNGAVEIYTTGGKHIKKLTELAPSGISIAGDNIYYTDVSKFDEGITRQMVLHADTGETEALPDNHYFTGKLGDQLAFVSLGEDADQTYLQNADGTGKQVIANSQSIPYRFGDDVVYLSMKDYKVYRRTIGESKAQLVLEPQVAFICFD